MFKKSYRFLLANAKRIKVILTTYFGGVCNNFALLNDLSFSGYYFDLDQQEYHSMIKQWIKQSINWQENIGIDVLVHGEFERNDTVEYFGE